VRFDPQGSEILTGPTALMAVKDELEASGLRVTSARLTMEAKQTTQPNGADTAKVVAFLEALEEHEDVQTVYSNAEFDDAALEALA
jgi:transcriptional/translational regulatory protein YebC/TACO1